MVDNPFKISKHSNVRNYLDQRLDRRSHKAEVIGSNPIVVTSTVNVRGNIFQW